MRAVLDVKYPNKTWDEMLQYKRDKYGLIGEDAYIDIIRSSTTTNKKFDKKVGIEDED